MRIRWLVLAAMAAMTWAGSAEAQNSCRPAEASSIVNLPARPYAAIASADGCRIFVTTQNTPGPGGLALVTYSNGSYSVAGSIALTIQPAGLTLSHDGDLLVAAGADGIAFVDARQFTLLATLDDGSKGPIMARISSDDSLLFVSDEFGNSVTVIDLPRARATGFTADSIVAKIATGTQPVGLALSPDQSRLFAAVEIGKEGEAECRDGARAGATPPAPFPQGTLTVIDIQKRAVIAELPAGCRPIRVTLSGDGKRAFVSARGSNEIVAFDIQTNERVGSIKLPSASFGMTMAKDDSVLYVSSGQSVLRVDPEKLTIAGSVSVSGSGRDLNASPDGAFLLLTVGATSALEIVQRPR